MEQIPFPQSRFLETTAILPMNDPFGTLTYLDMVETTKTPEEDYAEIGLQVFTKSIEAKSHQVEARTKASTIMEMSAIGVNAAAEMHAVLYDETCLSIEKEIIDTYANLGHLTREETLTKRQRLLKKWFKTEFPIYALENDGKALGRRLFTLSQLIAAKSRLGAANFCIVNTSIACTLENSPSFVYAENAISLRNPGTIHLVGTIGNIEIYVNPNLSYFDNQVILGRKTRKNDPGVYFCQHNMEMQSVEIPHHYEPEFLHRLVSRYAILEVGKKASNSFYTNYVVFGKKPLWRRLLRV